MEDRLITKFSRAGYPRATASRLCDALSSEFLTRIEGAADSNAVRRIVDEAEAELKASVTEDEE